MLRFTVLALLFAAVCASPINEDSKSSNLEVGVVESIDKYLAENPDVEILDEFEKEEDQDRRVLTYRIGQRINGKWQCVFGINLLCGIIAKIKISANVNSLLFHTFMYI